MSNASDVLVASSQAESRTAVVSALRRFPLHIMVCGALQQAEEILSQQTVELVFCDESLSDGSFRELLALMNGKNAKSKVVVTLRTGEWEEYVEAMDLGAFDAIRCPLRDSEVETVVNYVLRKNPESSITTDCLRQADVR